MNKHLLLIICIVTFSTVAFSQTLNELKAKLEKETNPNELSKIYRDIGTIYYNDGDFTNALNHFFKFLETAEKADNKYNIAVSYQAIGSVYMETEKFDEAAKYLEKAEQILFDLNEIESLGRTKITLGNVYYLQYQDSISEIYYKEALHYFQVINDSVGLRDAYKNLGSLYFEMGNQKDTLIGAEFMKNSLKYVKNDDTLNLFQTLVCLGEIYAYSGNLSEAKIYLDRCAELIPHIKAIHKKVDYYYALHHYHKAIGDFEQALSSYKLYTTHKDSILNTENNNLLNELNIKYETEQKEQQIELLNTQKGKQQLTIIVIILSSALLSIISILLFVKYKKKQKRKSEQELQAQKDAERIRIARDLHDSIGQKLSVMKMLLSVNQTNENTVKIAEFLDKTTEEVRSISHNLVPEILNYGFIKALENLIRQINDSQKITINLQIADEVNMLSIDKQTEVSLYRIMQEIINNIVRHAQADNIFINVSTKENILQINIQDNGIGFDTKSINNSEGLGWKNIFARIKFINGELKIQSEKNKGSGFYIKIPVV